MKARTALSMSTLFLTVLLNLAPFAQTGEVGAAPAPPPPMSDLPDLTNGERYVLPVDDIIVAQTFKGKYDSYAARYAELGLTSNSAISQLLGKKLSSNRLVNWGGDPKPELIATGRLYRSDTDVGVTFTLSDYSGGPHLETTLLTKSGTALSEIRTQTIPMAVLGPRAVAVADFNGDGLHDVVFHAGSTEADGSRTIIGTTSGQPVGSSLSFGPEYVGRRACLDMKAGDLNGDGRPEIICLVHDDFFLYVKVQTVDPATLEIHDPPNNYYTAPWGWDGGKYRLAVGKFDDNMADAEVAIVQAPSAGCSTAVYCSVYVTPIKVSIAPPPPTGTGEVLFAAAPAVDIGPYLNGSTGSGWKRLVGLEVATGKLNWFGGNPRDQIVVGAGMNSDSHYKGYAAVVVNFETSADLATGSTNPMSINTSQIKASAYNNAAAPTTCLLGVAVGRFSPPPIDLTPDNPNDPLTPANSQVALLLGVLGSGDSQQIDCGPDVWNTVFYAGMSVGIYTVDPANSYKTALSSSHVLSTGGHEYDGITFAPPRMAVGDFQGRSLLLGQPTIITVANQIQPQFVIGAPPMHLDYFKPPLSTSDRADCYARDLPDTEEKEGANVYGQEPTSGSGSSDALGCIQNVSAYPGLNTSGDTISCDYCARFSTSTDAKLAGYQESTTSTTWSNEGGGSASITFGTLKPKAISKGGFQIEGHGSAKRMHEETDSTRNETMANTRIDLSVVTSTDDEVLYSTQDVYLYFYPVIGQNDDNGNPVYLHFSVPDKTRYWSAQASDLPWFQPPHVVGNIFSYPGNSKQLVNDYPGAADRSGAVGWTSKSPTTAKITWTEDKSTTKTAGSVDRTEWNVGASVAGAYKFSRLGADMTIKANAYYDHNGSTTYQDTNTNKKSLEKSEGFSVRSVGFDKVDDSAYRVEARILGSQTPTLESGYWDQPVPMPKPDGTAGEGFVPDLTLDGPMHLVYSADMLSSTDFKAGGLWPAVYGKAPDIALQHHKRFIRMGKDTTAATDWWKFVPLYDNVTLDTLYLAENLKMKGFFINPESALPGQGPQMTIAEEGTKLRLAARIYNYSLADLPAGATVKVRFYVHQLSADDAFHRIWAPGGCTLIGESSITSDIIGGFRSDIGAEVATNRAMAYTIFDTTGRSGQYLMFWVVAWAEDANGAMVPELAQHGLAGKPPAGCPANSILGMPMEFYSNNVGFYEQEFFIMPTTLAAAPMPTAKPLRPFSIGALTVSPVNAGLPYAGELWELEAPLQAGDQDAFSVHLVHAGRGPGGRVSNTGFIQYIEAGQTYADRLTFRPLWCGPHSALVMARPAFNDPVSATLELEIPCRPEDVTAFFNDVLTGATLAGIVDINKNGQVEGRLAALQNAVLTAEKLAHKGATKGACQQYAEAIVRVADAGNGPVAQLLEDIIRNARGQLGCR